VALGAEPFPEEGGVIFARTRRGVGTFRDPGTGRFIDREAAIGRLRFDFNAGRIRDSAGRFVGVANLRFPSLGRVTDYKVLSSASARLTADPRLYRPAANQQVVESLLLVGRDGKLVRVERAFKLGERYDQAQAAGGWRAKAGDALGEKGGGFIPYAKLKGAVLQREFVVKTWTPRG